MKGDFSRDTFHPSKHFSRVLRQQGRVTLDSDPNEQTAILLHLQRSLARDLVGRHGGPARRAGFALAADDKLGLVIRRGVYYVDGILVENEADVGYREQPDYPLPDDDPLGAALAEADTERDFWVYLDVWERHITPIEDDDIREKALAGPHTCTRAQVVWQVKARVSTGLAAGNTKTRTLLKKWHKKLADIRKKDETPAVIAEQIEAHCEALAEICAKAGAGLVSTGKASMEAQVDPGKFYEDPCETRPDAKYRGVENHLYRVEIHRPGKAGKAMFKWSRENGSVVTAWLGTFGDDLQVAASRGFAAGDWVELSNDELELRGESGVLVKLTQVEGDRLTVDPDSVPAADALAWSDRAGSPKVRRWDQTQTGDVVLVEGAVPIDETDWIDLEDGVQIRFDAGGEYRTGDYWLIPARVATGDIEWPEGASRPPDGIVHHYAPIGFVTWQGKEMQFTSCRRLFDPLATCEALFEEVG